MRREMAENMEGEFSASGPQLQALLEQGLVVKFEEDILDPKPEQVWEAQWQAFLKAMEPSPSHTSKPQVPETAVSEDDKSEKSSSMGPKEARDRYLRSFSEKIQLTQGLLHLREKSIDEETEPPSAGVSRRRFRQFSYPEAMDPLLVYVQLWKLCCQWLKPEKHTKVEILELVILEQFIAILPQEIQDRMKEHSPETCAQAVVLVKEFLRTQHERGSSEEQGPGLCQEVDVSFSSGRKNILENPQTKIWNIVKEGGEGSASLVGQRCLLKEKSHIQEGPEQEDCEILGENIIEKEVIYCKQAKAAYGLCGARGHSESNQKAGVDLSVPSRVSYRELNEILTKEKMGSLSKNKESLVILNRTRAEEKPFKCSDCGKSFRMKSNLVRHRQSQTGEKLYGCLDCGKSFSSKNCLFRHHNIHHGEKPHEYSYDGKHFQMKYNLKQHNRIHTEEKPFECSDCGMSFTNNSDLVKHNCIHTRKKLFECSDCGKSFTRNSDLVRHNWIHTGKKPYECSDCGKSFTKNWDLKRHKRIHTRKKSFECPLCSKSFTKNWDLVRHKRMHTRKKSFKCTDCGKSFTKNSDLVRHNWIHTGKKPFECSDCGKSFTKNSDLLRHNLIHTRKKPFECSDCGKSFIKNSDLLRHNLIHTRKKPYECSNCSKSFTYNSDLVRHQRTHTGRKRFKCSECGKTFRAKCGLLSHVKSHKLLENSSCLSSS
ncbi:zinc finger protein ZFP2 [Anolis carolinensis]|uniref:zinc finger protein ZFP2 n=1 Tax=Anolis carolinensis TaxID=28377 RepID=UPI002F2B77DF